ncbi:PREDICTED: WD repeat-containing protein 25 isoform X2 [Tarenaya hassleriana]|uniref:WD repeat-containing protein 25 isoform X2 n=1 Tax=Tarenaya hassleriana TaxID=28532 RepID=UPI00053C7CB0|nr:PREDICTED: WD repeat-containing protein 25 isoform X2 [Tarenaya hassleriana]
MDLLCNSYADSSDEELEHQTGMRPPPGTANETPPSKRPRPSPGHPYNSFQRPPFYCSYSDPQTSSAVSIPGRYVSKRERSLHKSLPSGLNRDQGSDLVQNISAASPTVHLLASAGLDGAVYVWNVWSKDKKKARAFHCHDAPVKDVKWSKQGLSMLSCGYDCSSRLVDVEKGIQIQTFKEDQVVGVVKFDPDNYNTFLSGGLKGSLRLWDIRTNKVVHEYIRDLGPILDVEFVNGGERFISSSDVSSGNTSENAIIVWDIKREVPLSNQVYSEAYTCPCIKRHPRDPIFVAQSNGNYIAIFSTNPPFKLNKYMRYESHWVSGFPVKCSFSPDGQTLASGSADGSIYIYGYKSSDVIKKIKAYEQPCLDIAHHPVLSNVIASCSWDGEVSIFE